MACDVSPVAMFDCLPTNFALRNPDCTADHHSNWGDPPECSTVTGSECPIASLPLLLSLKVIRAQMMGGAGSSQPIVIQTAPIQAQIAQPAQVNSCY